MKTLNPRLVYCSLSGFGQDGPYRDFPAHDMNYLSLAGVLNLICEPDRIVEADHPKFGKVKQFGIAIKLSDTPGSVRSAAPTSGEQTEDVLKSLGLTAEAIADLRKQSVIE